MIKSEVILPAFSHIIQEMVDDCIVEDKFEQVRACERLWLALDALNKVTCCFQNGGTAASLAITNQKLKIANYIEWKIGINPLKDKGFASWDTNEANLNPTQT